MKILITGANGFIGKAVVASLSAEHEIVALVRDPNKCPPHKGVKFVAHDFSAKLDISALPTSINAIIHLAQSNQYRSFPDGMRDMCEVNISGIVDVLDYARNANCSQFINFSSGSVYSSDPANQSEDSTINPTAAYPLSKYVSEQVTNLYSSFFNTLNMRLFFPYGPGQEGMLISNIINSVKNGSDIGLQGNDGGLVLCPIYVDDVIRVCENCLAQEKTGVINVGGTETLTLQNIALAIAENVNKEPVFNIDSSAKPARFEPTLERMKKILGNATLTPFSEGIRKTVIAAQ